MFARNENESNNIMYQPQKIIPSPSGGSGFVDYDQTNGTCSECEDFCGLTCFPVCLFFQNSDCRIPEQPFNHSGMLQKLRNRHTLTGIDFIICFNQINVIIPIFPTEFSQYHQLKNALEENNIYIGSHLDSCYQCVLRFSSNNLTGYDNTGNHNESDDELELLNIYNFTLQNGKLFLFMVYKDWSKINI